MSKTTKKSKFKNVPEDKEEYVNKKRILKLKKIKKEAKYKDYNGSK